MSTGYRVLHVGDDSTCLERTTTALEADRDGFAVRATTDTDEALDWLTADEFDCVVAAVSGGRDGPSLSFLRDVADVDPDLPRLLFTSAEAVPVEVVDAGVAGVVSQESDEPFTRLASRIVEVVERRRAAAEQARDCRLLSTLVEESTDAFVVIGRDWQFEYVSPAMKRLLGYDPDELIGETCFEYVHPNDRSGARERLDELADRPDAVFSGDFRLRHADGSWVWVENRGRNLLDDPDVEGIVVSSRDVTERKRREERLRRTESIVESMNDVAYTVDESLVVTYVNDRALEYAELPREAVVGESIRGLSERMLADPETVDRFVDTLTSVVDGASDSERLGFEIDLPRGTVYAELQMSPLRPLDENGDEPRGAVIVSRDVTERREYERELERQNDRLDAFTSVISHDLRGPLSVAAGNVELARAECDSDRLDVVERAHERMSDLVDNLLAVARHGTPVDDPESVDLDAVAERCWAFVETADATVEIDTGLVVRANEWRLRQFFENLFRNSIEHGLTGPRSGGS
ncbi:PAS domain-containing protein [Salinigranum sp. GCM10025319]|uniref:PAS domain-containing protein n=1 Tax=Salinigranum sp. GCM10025319 TaxID=3252687 RepID=UPI0036120D77